MFNFSKERQPKGMKPSRVQAKGAPSLSTSETIYGDVEFGNPRIDCRNFGICKVAILDHLKVTYEPKSACATILFSNSQVEIRFLKKDMHPLVKSKYFLSGFFQIDSQFIFSKEIQNRVKTENIKIKQGKYKIIQDENFFILKL